MSVYSILLLKDACHDQNKLLTDVEHSMFMCELETLNKSIRPTSFFDANFNYLFIFSYFRYYSFHIFYWENLSGFRYKFKLIIFNGAH